MMGIADQKKAMELGTWVWVFCRNGMAFLFLSIYCGIITHSMPRPRIFLFYAP